MSSSVAHSTYARYTHRHRHFPADHSCKEHVNVDVHIAWLMTRAQLLLLLLGPASAWGTPLQTTTLVTPWCKDSLRIQIRPTIGGAKELPINALTDTNCPPGPPHQLDKQNPILTNNNLQVAFTETGTLVFHRQDTDTLLFSLNVTMTPSSVMPGKGFFATNATLTEGDKT